jgi:hypothetical protein
MRRTDVALRKKGGKSDTLVPHSGQKSGVAAKHADEFSLSQLTENGRFWPIVLKKSAMVCASEKYASEIEIFTFGRGFRTRISHGRVQNRSALFPVP